MRLCLIVPIVALLLVGPLCADEPKDTSHGKLSLGYKIVSVTGNEWRFRQYSSPDTGLYDSWVKFYWTKPGATEQPVWWDLSADVLAPKDFRASLNWRGQWPMSHVHAYYTGYRFYPETLGVDPGTFAFDRAYTSAYARRRNAGIGGVFYFGGGSPFEFWYGQTTYVGTGAIRGIAYPATPDFNTRDFRLVREGNLGPTADYGVVLYQRKFSDGTTLQPDARTRGGKFRVGLPLGESASLDAHYTRGSVSQTGFSGMDFSMGGVTVDAAWDSGLGLQAFLNRMTIDNNVTVNAFTQRVTRSGLKLSYSGINRFNLRAGAEFSSFRQRVTASATSSANPDRKRYWVSFVARPSKKVRLRAKYQTSDASGLTTGRYGSMPDGRKRAEAELRFAPSGRCSFSLTGARESRKNPLESANYDITTYGATLWTQVSDEINLFGYYNTYNWDSDAALLGGWISDADVWGAYAQVTINSSSYASLGYELARSTGSTQTTDQSILLGVGWNAGPHSRYSIQYRHQRFDEKLFDRSSFNANVVSANGVFEF